MTLKICGLVYGPTAGPHSLATADVTLLGEDVDDSLGNAVSSGDVNGDGFSDLLISAPGARSGAGPRAEGVVYLFYGPVEGRLSPSEADALVEATTDTVFGFFVSAAGDLNGDGYDDVLIGDIRNSAGAYWGGAVYLFYGPLAGTYAAAEADALVYGTHDNEYAGWFISSGGDINGDGADDLLIGAPGESSSSCSNGVVYLVSGPLYGEVSLADADARLYSTRFADQAGSSISSQGDVNNDGYADVLIGAIGYDPRCTGAPGDYAGTGTAYLLYGPLTGARDLAGADVVLTGEAREDFAGSGVSLEGDFDGDGFHDVLVGAPGNSRGGDEAGTVYLFYGRLLEAATHSLANADSRVVSDLAYHSAGEALAAGDINGDGYDDVLIGAPRAGPSGSGGGAVYALLGGPRLEQPPTQ